MKLTPLDIHHKEFRRSIRGYNEEEVDIFLDQVAEEFERLFKENAELNSRVDGMKDKVKQYEGVEQTLQKALLTGQQAADQVQEEARKESELIIQDAEQKAKQLIEATLQEKEGLRAELDRLRESEDTFRGKFKELLAQYMEAVKDARIPEPEPEVFAAPVVEPAEEPASEEEEHVAMSESAEQPASRSEVRPFPQIQTEPVGPEEETPAAQPEPERHREGGGGEGDDDETDYGSPEASASDGGVPTADVRPEAFSFSEPDVGASGVTPDPGGKTGPDSGFAAPDAAADTPSEQKSYPHTSFFSEDPEPATSEVPPRAETFGEEVKVTLGQPSAPDVNSGGADSGGKGDGGRDAEDIFADLSGQNVPEFDPRGEAEPKADKSGPDVVSSFFDDDLGLDEEFDLDEDERKQGDSADTGGDTQLS